MNVFKTYSNLLTVIFILSLKTLNAPSNEEIKERIAQCVQDINVAFGSDSFHQHAVRAMSRFEYKENPGHPELNRCVYSFDENLYIDYPGHTNVCAYYCSFREYLLVGQIPNLQTFCDKFIGLLETPGNCFRILVGYYSANRNTALQTAFYNYRLGRIPTVKLTIIVPKNYAQAHKQNQYIDQNEFRPYVEEIEDERYIDVSVVYFDLIKLSFRVKTDSDNDDVNDRMLNPLEFCTKQHSE